MKSPKVCLAFCVYLASLIDFSRRERWRDEETLGCIKGEREKRKGELERKRSKGMGNELFF